MVVPFSSVLENITNPSHILINQGEGGLNVNSVAMCDVLTSVEKRYLEHGTYGEITPESFARIQRGIQIAIGIY